jgi:glycosyltransferase involved in cell wall biosynthesis
MLFVGRVVYQKGLDLLFNALGKIKDSAWELSIAGDGPRVDDLKAQARQLGIDKKVTFLGWQTSSQLPGVLLAANLFVHPSRHEGMPNALLEAMASGLPAVATRIAGNEELVTMDTGVLVPAEDPEALRAALVPLLADSSLREKLGHAARKRVSAEYSWRQVAEAYLDLMMAAIQRK